MTRRIAVAGVLAVCFTALLVAGIAYVLVSRNARRAEDSLLVSEVSRPARLLSAKDAHLLAQIDTATGSVAFRTAALERLGQLPLLRKGYANVRLDGHALRVLTAVGPRGRRVSVAISDAQAGASLRRLRGGVVIAMIAGALLVSLLLIWITRRALAPVRETAAVADRIVSTGELAARVPEPPGDDEVARLSRSINRMLDHLQASDVALRRLVADASHELRSPVTTLRGNLELLSAGALTGADQAEALADAAAEAERLGELVEDLLTLARADTVTPAERVELAPLLADAILGTGARMRTPSPDLRGAAVDGDPVALRALFRNLVENADRYAGAGAGAGAGAELTLSGDRGWLTVAVIDHGPGVPASERELIFGRFARGSTAHGAAGSGLGLAIVEATARAHGGSVSLTGTPGGGATFTVRLPRAAG